MQVPVRHKGLKAAQELWQSGDDVRLHRRLRWHYSCGIAHVECSGGIVLHEQVLRVVAHGEGGLGGEWMKRI